FNSPNFSVPLYDDMVAIHSGLSYIPLGQSVGTGPKYIEFGKCIKDLVVYVINDAGPGWIKFPDLAAPIDVLNSNTNLYGPDPKRITPGTAGTSFKLENIYDTRILVEDNPLDGLNIAFFVESVVENDFSIHSPSDLCVGNMNAFSISSPTGLQNKTINWDFGDGETWSNTSGGFKSYASTGTYTLVVTVTSPEGCITQEVLVINVENEITRNISIRGVNEVCLGNEVQFFAEGDLDDAISFNWTFSNAQSSNRRNPRVYFSIEDEYTAALNVTYAQNCLSASSITTDQILVNAADYEYCITCSECIGSFSPLAGEQYVVSAWVKETDLTLEKTSYQDAAISFFYEGSNTSSANFKANGPIIEGWQLIEEVFTIPVQATSIQIELVNLGSEDVYFDDIRIYPFNANLKSFVYDPISMRLTAELDENNYATFYEYDEDGNLIRVKKETERGIKTIQETIKRVKQND
ncbi:MAG: PKD domain-containing protein, partial [Flavobacteriales bacterium]|nr:PKD domain-containing protein [Flavobacteriales bacterium]